MWGCCSRAANRISRRKRSRTEAGGELGTQQLEGDRPVVPQVVGTIDNGHAAPPELAVEAVAAGQVAARRRGMSPRSAKGELR